MVLENFIYYPIGVLDVLGVQLLKIFAHSVLDDLAETRVDVVLTVNKLVDALRLIEILVRKVVEKHWKLTERLYLLKPESPDLFRLLALVSFHYGSRHLDQIVDASLLLKVFEDRELGLVFVALFVITGLTSLVFFTVSDASYVNFENTSER